MQPLNFSMTQSVLTNNRRLKASSVKPPVPRSEPVMYPISKENVPPPLPPRRLNPLPLWSSSAPSTTEDIVDRLLIISDCLDVEDPEWVEIDDWMDVPENPTLCDSDRDKGWATIDPTTPFVNQRRARLRNTIQRFPCLTEFGNLGAQGLPTIQEGDEIISPNVLNTKSSPLNLPVSIAQDGFGHENKMDHVPLFAAPTPMTPIMFLPGSWSNY
ncbi:hypothetical protein BDN72DRAFT_863630 [Pluteus cervinus]|uniref:Uncharacterized protein n=1 Tax=Pluteus cervinus TaxID=181527 RepID=A0ACD3A7L7_9AGAR|nr:hypothetical protein BDN72DRAFT_863630 [Pluteus cervinus]